MILALDGHCIQTAARRLYRQWSDQLLGDHPADPQRSSTKAEVGPGLVKGAAERDLELLRCFLEQVDFPAVRASDPDLAGQGHIRVRIFWTAVGRVGWEKIK